ncbi:MAG: hypothetical protein J6T67_07330 [Paludibacteraceae bacterium]|nr:hypothetical protein [Paludibacteraceae bacterium]
MSRHKVRIKKIDWLDKDGREAEVCFEAGLGQYWAFCHPCTLREGEEKHVDLDFLYSEETWEEMFSNNRDEEMKMTPSLHDRTRYKCYGRIIQINPVMVDCGDIRFDLGEMTHDDKVIGAWIYFTISRLDISPTSND